MKSIRRLLYSLIIIFATLSCVEELMPSDGQLADKPYRLSVNREALQLGADENLSAQFVVLSKEGTPWEITGVPEWLSVSARKGDSEAVITVTATENKMIDESRTAVIQVRSTSKQYQFSKSITITQSCAKVYLNVDKNSLSFAPQAVWEKVAVD